MITTVEFGVEVRDHITDKKVKLFTPMICLTMKKSEESDETVTLSFVADKSTTDFEAAKEIMDIVKDALEEPDVKGKITEEGNVDQSI